MNNKTNKAKAIRARYIRAVRQLMLENNCEQVFFDDTDIYQPTMMHYDGNTVPVYSVTLPEAVPEDQRDPSYTPEAMACGIVLCCEDRGYIHTELFHENEPEDNSGIVWCLLWVGVRTQMRRHRFAAADKYYLLFVSWNRKGETCRNELHDSILYPTKEEAWQRIAEEVAFLAENGDDLLNREDAVLEPAPQFDEQNSNHNHGALKFNPQDIQDKDTFRIYPKKDEEFPSLADSYLEFSIRTVIRR